MSCPAARPPGGTALRIPAVLATVLLLAALPLAEAAPPQPPAAHVRPNHGPGPGPGPTPNPGPHAPGANATLFDQLPRQVMRTVGPPGALLLQAGVVDPAHHGPQDPVEPLLMHATRSAFGETMHALFLLADLSHQVPDGEARGAAAMVLERVRGVPDGAALPAVPAPDAAHAVPAAPAPPLPELPPALAVMAGPALRDLPVQVLPAVPEAEAVTPGPELPAPAPPPQPAPLEAPAPPCLGRLDLACLGLSRTGEAGQDAAGTQARALPLADAGAGRRDRGAGGSPGDGGVQADDAVPRGEGAGAAGGAPRAAADPAAPAALPSGGWHDGAVLSLASAALLGPFLALYRRIARETCLRNDLRRRLFERIRAAPGVTIDRLAKGEGVAYQTVQHHARLLEGLGYVETWRDGARLHLFENGGRYSAGEKRLHVVASGPAAAALAAVRAQPGSGPVEVSRALGVSRGTARFHLVRLAERGLLRLERDGGRVRAWPVAPAE